MLDLDTVFSKNHSLAAHKNYFSLCQLQWLFAGPSVNILQG